MSEKVKKSIYKKWWFWLIVLIVFSGIIGSISDNNDVAKEPEKVEDVISEQRGFEDEPAETAEELEENEDDAVEEEADETSDNIIFPGTYKVGEDMAPGEYLIIPHSGMAYIESAKDSTGKIESIIFNDNLINGANSYVTLNEGEYFKIEGADAYSMEVAPKLNPVDGIYRDGMYKVGQDIPAGEYKVILDSDIGFGYIEVSKDSSHKIESIVTNENIQADTYITVSDGQYLKLQDAYIKVD